VKGSKGRQDSFPCRPSPFLKKQIPGGKETMFSTEELALIIRALKSHRKECCVAIDELKKLIGKDDPAYTQMTGEYYSDINITSNLIDKIRFDKIRLIPEKTAAGR
jgi:hypothetical protein